LSGIRPAKFVGYYVLKHGVRVRMAKFVGIEKNSFVLSDRTIRQFFGITMVSEKSLANLRNVGPHPHCWAPNRTQIGTL
jgi:hypothetical protein